MDERPDESNGPAGNDDAYFSGCAWLFLSIIWLCDLPENATPWQAGPVKTTGSRARLWWYSVMTFLTGYALKSWHQLYALSLVSNKSPCNGHSACLLFHLKHVNPWTQVGRWTWRTVWLDLAPVLPHLQQLSLSFNSRKTICKNTRVLRPL